VYIGSSNVLKISSTPCYIYKDVFCVKLLWNIVKIYTQPRYGIHSYAVNISRFVEQNSVDFLGEKLMW